MGKKKRTYMSDAQQLYFRTYQQYFNRLCELATCMFEWKNLPSSIDERFLEITLFERGNAIYFNDKVLGDLALPMVSNGKFNVYRQPLDRIAYASNGYNIKLDDKNSVIIYNNYLRTNSLNDVEMYARRLTELDRIIDINVKAQKTPILIACDEKQRLTMENVYKGYDGGEPVIFGTSDLNPKGLSVLKTDAPYNADKLYSLKMQYWNEALTCLGISNINVQKKERLISDEVTRNQGGTIASRYSRLESRRQAVKMINKMFDHNIEVNFREDFQYIDEDMFSPTVDNVDEGGLGDE